MTDGAFDYQTDMQVWDAAHARTRQKNLGPSDVGRCLRQSGYNWHDVPRTDERSRGRALLGSLMHLGWAAIIAAANDPNRLAEVEVTIPDLGTGHADDVDFDARVVNDLKSASARSYERYVTSGLPDSYWDQPDLYAYGLWLEEATSISIAHPDRAMPDIIASMEPWTLRVTLVNRESGEEMPFEQAADLERGAYLAQRMVERQRMLEASTVPEDLPREGAGPGRGFPCDYCDWVTACWGGEREDGLSPQAALIADDEAAIVATLAEYRTAADELGKLEKVKADARAALTGLPGGDYGDYRLTWRGGNPKAPEPDVGAALEMLDELGVPVPQRDGLKTNVTISVTRRKPDAPKKRDKAARVTDGHATSQGVLGGTPGQPSPDGDDPAGEGA